MNYQNISCQLWHTILFGRTVKGLRRYIIGVQLAVAT
jgi:hypothetical protein